MPDREKVEKGLNICNSINHPCNECPYVRERNCSLAMVEDALAMLKDQEAVKPRVSCVEQRCGNCNKVIEMDGWKVCPWCGKPILWEAVRRLVKWE